LKTGKLTRGLFQGPNFLGREFYQKKICSKGGTFRLGCGYYIRITNFFFTSFLKKKGGAEKNMYRKLEGKKSFLQIRGEFSW